MLYLSKSSKETENLAIFLLNKVLKLNPAITSKEALVVALEGELGAGKTVFVKGAAKALGIKGKIKSPTFTLIKKHPIFLSKCFKFLYHLDCYRLRDHRDLAILGIGEILNDPQNLILIEWSDRVKKILPKKHIKIHIDHIGKATRKISVAL